MAGYEELCELVGLNIGSTIGVENVIAEREIRDLGTGFGNGRSCAADEITVKMGKYGADC
jgi:hypothetical protein